MGFINGSEHVKKALNEMINNVLVFSRSHEQVRIFLRRAVRGAWRRRVAVAPKLACAEQSSCDMHSSSVDAVNIICRCPGKSSGGLVRRKRMQERKLIHPLRPPHAVILYPLRSSPGHHTY